MTRTHEFLLAGDAQSYDRLGVAYTEGAARAVLYRPDSMHSEQSRPLEYAEVKALRDFLTEVVKLMDAVEAPE